MMGNHLSMIDSTEFEKYIHVVMSSYFMKFTFFVIGILIYACYGFRASSENRPLASYSQVSQWSEPILEYLIWLAEETSVNFFLSKFKHFHPRKCIWMCPLRNGRHFVSVSMWWLTSRGRSRNFKLVIFKLILRISHEIPSGECHWSSLAIRQDWLSLWLIVPSDSKSLLELMFMTHIAHNEWTHLLPWTK